MLKIRQVNEQQINAALQAVQNEQDKIDNKMNDMSKKFSKSLLELDEAVGDNLGYLNDNFVPNTRKINGHELTDDITLTASDVGAATTGDIGNAISALDVSSVGGSGKYISEISESNGLIIGTASNLSDASVGSAGKWTTARDIKIQDADGTNTGSAVSVDGSANKTLKLPSTIKATLSGNASTATSATRLGSIAIANIRIGSSQARISLNQLMTWLITTKAYIPSGTDCYKVLGVPWDYSGNDILQLSANGASFELQLAGCLIEFMGNATNYNTGRFRLRIHSSPTTSFTVTSGYIKFPVSRIAEYTCNGSGYTPTWKVVGTDEKYANSFWGMTDPDGADNVWIRSTSQGLLPYQSGGAGSGHNYLGTSSWYWKYAYIDQIYGYLNGNISGSAKTANNIVAWCSTTGSTAEKVATLPNFVLETGQAILLYMEYANSATYPTLNVNGTGAKTIRYNGTGVSILADELFQKGLYIAKYNGTYWDLTCILSGGTRNSFNSTGASAFWEGIAVKSFFVGDYNGYISFRNGLLLQWGRLTVSTSQGYALTYPQAFASANSYYVGAEPNSYNNNVMNCYNKTATGCTVNRASSASTDWAWFAIGRQ